MSELTALQLYRRAWYEKNKEAVKAQSRAWSAANREHKAEVGREYRANNKERCAANAKAWSEKNGAKTRAASAKYRTEKLDRARANEAAYRERNRDECNARIREWKLRNPHKATHYFHKRRAAELLATPAWADADAIEAIYADAQAMRDEYGSAYHVDHIVPLLSPLVCGLHCEANLKAVPPLVNLKKSNRHWPDMP